MVFDRLFLDQRSLGAWDAGASAGAFADEAGKGLCALAVRYQIRPVQARRAEGGME
jgi:hypothetical protein